MIHALLAVDSVHTRAAAADYLQGRLATTIAGRYWPSTETVPVVVIPPTDSGERRRHG